ncbi:CDP-diacylglycerol--serine O-phosphatidyltransferase [Porphyromonas sp.]|uniref:CDP-diacylglycerol--serine O-phosphatidyltransferase n=1 Tax=Porphyromonas sp. TaxID=1924944 RepID=UPI0026DC13B0|nr:CDP-diacylglycerol--serine O-phosphatidyltransferase [Porphyromonas sp.]MDO4695137.1 CDP-diacylglycerol--serine O-phosphatidyltransferase [Porphyromonas sp.]MDO4770219.1 CDP-diacylglycerol--serine O-phosphatidyltransferase [Porphyromonas sp.]
MKIRQHIPNLLSLSNATSGTIATYFAANGFLVYAMICMAVGLVADFLDGFMARKLNAFSPLGKDLDSLADAISFGVAPATMMTIALQRIGFIFPWLAFLIVPASVYRLAKFNHDERQSTSFIGLPTPANALFWASLAYWISGHIELIEGLPRMIAYKVYALWPLLIILMSWLLISEVSMFSLKGGRPTWKKDKGLFIVLGIAVVSLLLMGLSAFVPTIGAYVLINVIAHLRSKAPKG